MCLYVRLKKATRSSLILGEPGAAITPLFATYTDRHHHQSLILLVMCASSCCGWCVDCCRFVRRRHPSGPYSQGTPSWSVQRITSEWRDENIGFRSYFRRDRAAHLSDHPCPTHRQRWDARRRSSGDKVRACVRLEKTENLIFARYKVVTLSVSTGSVNCIFAAPPDFSRRCTTFD